jgi:hypothetical protein
VSNKGQHTCICHGGIHRQENSIVAPAHLLR